MKKIDIMMNSFRIGGSQTFALELARRLEDEGYLVRVIAKRGPTETIFHEEYIKTRRILWYEGSEEDSKKFQGRIKLWLTYLLLIKLRIGWLIRRPDLIISSQPWPTYYAARFVPKSVPVVPLVHGFTSVEFPPAKFEKIRHRVHSPVCVSDETKMRIRENFGVESKVIGNLFSGERYWSTVEIFRVERNPVGNRIVIGSTLTANKVDIISNLLPIMKIEESWTLEIVGSGPEENRIRNRIRELQIENRVSIVNAGSNLRPHYEIASLLIGVGRVAIEGASRGVPVLIASDGHVFGMLTPENFHVAQKANFTGRATGSLPFNESLLRQMISENLSNGKVIDLDEVGRLAYNIGDIEPILKVIP